MSSALTTVLWAFGAAGAIEQGLEAQELGAAGVFVAPIGVQNDQVIFDYYASVAEALDIPVAIHDFPESFKTILSADLIARMANEIEGVQYIKLEDYPVLEKMSRILKHAPDAIGIFGGLGGMYFLEELERGSLGIMTGFAWPEVLVGVYEAFRSGDMDDAVAIFAPADEAHRLERRDAVLGVHRRGRDGADHRELRVRAHEALHEHARQVTAAVGHVHVPARAPLILALMLHLAHAHALLERIQRRVDLRRLLPLLGGVVHVVLLALAPGAVHQREAPGRARGQAARQAEHGVRPRRRRVAVRRRGGAPRLAGGDDGLQL